MKKIFILLFLSVIATFSAQAQRKTDKLDRGVVAVYTPNKGVFVSWRIQANEYYGVKYNLYRGGTLIAENLNVSNYQDAGGDTNSTYTVKAVVNGVAQEESKSAKVWSNGFNAAAGGAGEQPNHLTIPMKDVVDRNGNIVFCCCGQHTIAANVAQNYALNDASLADLDGDGEVEIIIKRQNYSDEIGTDSYSYSGQIFSKTNDRAYTIIEAYKLDGTRLWWIDCGPNMCSMNSVEINAVAYDWDEDGKAEVVMRGADNMIIHMADGKTYNVGNMSVNTRDDLVSHSNSQYAWTRTGAEYLLYLNGQTGSPYQIIDYPLPRYEANEIGMTEQKVWSPNNSNGGYGHRSSKYFFGAPVLDGRHASIFLARGIYTQTKMVALDVNKSTHQLTQRWYWRNNIVGSTWFGQGNHNFSIADVDGDGCDEIIYGSMVIDNNGKGLSTTGLGHGDALHVGDLDPFRKGLEVFACNEERPANNLRDATTSEILYRLTATGDDGRAMAGNFSDDYPGCLAASLKSGVISTVAHSIIDGLANGCFGKPWTPMSLNGRIYWDGDLLEEAFDSPGTEGEAVVTKNGSRYFQSSGCKLNNDSKNNQCAQGDILGDWREELVLRSWDNTTLHVFTTTYPTEYRIPSLWYDPEYRQAMVWQVCGYNQPPHVSYFMGKMEGLTKVPVPLTMEGRTEITSDGQSIPSGDVDVFVYNKGNINIPTSGASPRSLIIDVPSNVAGNDNNNNITYSYEVSRLSSGNLSGAMNFVKQGDGLLEIAANSTYSYTGNTDVFAGSVSFKGTMENSPVWMNRHTTLYNNGTFRHAVTMEYGSTMYIGQSYKSDGSAPENNYGTANVDTLNLHEGARLVFDIDKANKLSDVLNMQVLTIRKRDWQYGPEYLAPVLQVNSTATLEKGNYKIGKIDKVEGIDDIIIEGNFAAGTKQRLSNVSGILYLKVYDENDDPIVYPEASISMTHVNYDDPNTSYGELEKATSGYNKISNGNVAFANTSWKADWITYLKVDLSEYKQHDVSAITLSFEGSGSTDSNRTTCWGIGYNDSEWQPTMTYNTADKSITTIGGVQWSESKYSSVFKEFSWDITDVYNNDEDGIITILIYETAAAGGYVQNPKVDVQYSYVEVEEEPTNVVSGGTDVLFQYDFEDQSKIDGYWTTSTSGRYASSWVIRGVDTHYGKYNAGSTNGATLTFSAIKDLGSDYTSLESYKLEFDFAVEPINTASNSGDQTQIFEIYDSKNNVLCDWRLTSPKGAAGNRVGSFYLKGIETSHFNANTTPYFYHVTITGDGEGTNMEVVGADGEKSVYKLSDELVYIGNLKYNTAKSYGGLCLDDITLVHVTPSLLILSPTQEDDFDYEPGIYGMVKVDRVFKVGYSTLCVPFNTTVEEFTGGEDSEAYVAYLSGLEQENGSTILVFNNTQTIEANKPYIIYLSKVLEYPVFYNKPVYTENPRTITIQDGWSMTGNYNKGKSMYGLYGVANNAAIMKGSATATLKGLTAFITGPANASVKSRIMYNEVDGISSANAGDGIVTGIYNVSGAPVKSIQRGINIIRMSDGTSRKVFIK